MSSCDGAGICHPEMIRSSCSTQQAWAQFVPPSAEARLTSSAARQNPAACSGRASPASDFALMSLQHQLAGSVPDASAPPWKMVLLSPMFVHKRAS